VVRFKSGRQTALTSHVLYMEALPPPLLVMPGLDPGIHQSSQNYFTKQMDCRVV